MNQNHQLTDDYYNIKDQCRAGLLSYLNKACLKIPKAYNSRMLDVGCGTGVPTLWLAEHFAGTVTAIDMDCNATAFLQSKIIERNLQNRVKVLNLSFLDYKSEAEDFDIILAEGCLHVIGFESGFVSAIKILKSGGYFIIHDEHSNHLEKRDFIQKNNCGIIETLYLDEYIWWDEYYRPLEIEIRRIKDKKLLDLFQSDMQEIKNYRSGPSRFRSIYYVVKSEYKKDVRNFFN